jgi:hypothetical protein
MEPSAEHGSAAQDRTDGRPISPKVLRVSFRQAWRLTIYTETVSTMEQPDEPRLSVRPPAEALRAARPLPARQDLVIEDVPDEEWADFLEAVARA